MSKWISVDNKLPRKNEKVIIYTTFGSKFVPHSIHDATYTGSSFRRGAATVGVFDGDMGVTHWMPLPEPPQ